MHVGLFGCRAMRKRSLNKMHSHPGAIYRCRMALSRFGGGGSVHEGTDFNQTPRHFNIEVFHRLAIGSCIRCVEPVFGL